MAGRSAGTTLGDAPVEQVVAATLGTFNAHQYERHFALHALDFVLVDHRPIGWGEVRGREALGALVRSALSQSDDVRLEIDEVVACDRERVIAVRAVCAATDLVLPSAGRSPSASSRSPKQVC